MKNEALSSNPRPTERKKKRNIKVRNEKTTV
jgi:hypothetical protein